MILNSYMNIVNILAVYTVLFLPNIFLHTTTLTTVLPHVEFEISETVDRFSFK